MFSKRIAEIRLFLKWYLATLFVVVLVVAGLMFLSGLPFAQTFKLLPQVMQALAQSPITWIVLLLPYLAFRSVHYLLRVYRIQGVRSFIRIFALRVIVPLGVLIGLFKALSWYTTSENFAYQWDSSVENTQPHIRNLYAVDGKHRGVHFFAGSHVQAKHLLPLVCNNIEWIVQVPFGWQGDLNRPQVGFSALEDVVWSEKDSGIVEITRLAHEFGLKTMLKPHIWLRDAGRGQWRSDIFMENEGDWQKWFENYRRFILHYATLGETLRVEALCIGTELSATVKQRPADWRALIAAVRQVYHGKLTYAANWHQDFEQVPFWDALDYIGIQAYFPLTKQTTPTVDELVEGWQPYLQAIESISNKYHKPVLFTEIGYRSQADGAIEPWKWPRVLSGLFKKVSLQTQRNCYEAFFRVFWHRPWFAGAHFWKWDYVHEKAGGIANHDFTPQNKPAQNTLAKWFGRTPRQPTY